MAQRCTIQRGGGVRSYVPEPGHAAGGAPFDVTFLPVSATQTRCSARLVGYYNLALRSTDKPSLSGPYPANNEENTKEVQNLIAKAEKRLTVQNPEYRAP